MRKRAGGMWRWFRRRRWHWQLAIAVGVLFVLVVVVVATVQLVPEEEFAVDTGGPRSEPPAEVRHGLEARFAPVLKLDSHELLAPLDIPSYVSASSLEKRVGKRLTVVERTPAAQTLPSSEDGCRLGLGCTFVLDVRGAEPPRSKARDYKAIQDGLFAAGTQLTVNAHVLRYEDSGDIAIQYWFLYLFNYRLNEHESDWEQITIGLDKDGTAKKVLYSSHSTGFVRDWNEIEREGDHPVVYVAVGSHANYFHAGSHDVTISCPRLFKRRRICVRKRDIRDRSDGEGLVLEPQNYALAEFVPPVFIGSYGTGNYVLGRRSNEVLSDPRTRPAWTNPLARLERGKPL